MGEKKLNALDVCALSAQHKRRSPIGYAQRFVARNRDMVYIGPARDKRFHCVQVKYSGMCCIKEGGFTSRVLKVGIGAGGDQGVKALIFIVDDRPH